MAETINIELGGKNYTLPALALYQVTAVDRRLHFGRIHGRDHDILKIVWPKDAAEPLDAIQGVTGAEITAAAEQIIAAAGLTRTPHDLERRRALGITA